MAIIAGALVPDLPMFAFYLYQRLFAGRSEDMIWGELYFDSGWQIFFDVFNSLPFVAIGLVLVSLRKSPAGLAFLLSMALHLITDFLVHREDAHGHFYPLSQWHFVSPISYWDPAHYGLIFAGLEGFGVLVGCIILIRRGGPGRAVGYGTLALYVVLAGVIIRYWSAL